MAGLRFVPHTPRRVPRRSQIEGAHMRSKQGLLALLTCSAVAMGGLATETAVAKSAAPKHAKKSAKKAKRCKILMVNGVHRCKGEHARKTTSSNSSTAPAAPAPVVNNVTINNVDNPPVPAPAPAVAATPAVAPTPAPVNDKNNDGKPGNGPKPKKDKKDKQSHGRD